MLLGDLYDVPVVFAKKGETANCTDDKYISHAYSFTHKRMNNIFVSRPYLNAEDKVLIVDDFLARQAGDKKYILARKGPKLYMRDIFSVTVNSITTAKEQRLYLDGADAALMKGKKILIVDDVISTGESLRALEVLAEKAGGEICGRMAILAEGDAQEREDTTSAEIPSEGNTGDDNTDSGSTDSGNGGSTGGSNVSGGEDALE